MAQLTIRGCAVVRKYRAVASILVCLFRICILHERGIQPHIRLLPLTYHLLVENNLLSHPNPSEPCPILVARLVIFELLFLEPLLLPSFNLQTTLLLRTTRRLTQGAQESPKQSLSALLFLLRR